MRRTRRGRTEDAPESYWVSISDLMSGLLFVFIITLAVFSLRLATTSAALTSADETRKQILEEIEKRFEARTGIDVYVDLDQGLLRLPEKGIYFKAGEVHPRADHEEHVGELARALSEVLPCYVANRKHPLSHQTEEAPDWCSTSERQPYECPPRRAQLETLLIEGHTDTQPVRPGLRFRNNLELSSMRAAEVLLMMLRCEPELGRLMNQDRLQVVSISGYGKMRLVHPLDELSEQNRRIDLRFLMELPQPAAAIGTQDGEEPGNGFKEPEPERSVRERYDG